MKTWMRMCILAAGWLWASGSRADTLTSGWATIDYDSLALAGVAANLGPPPALTLTAYFDQAAANARTQTNLLEDILPGATYTGQIYALNGPVVTNLIERYTQPTTFDYAPGGLTAHRGSIGLGGVARFAVFGGFGGSLLFGDFTLQYDTNRWALGGSGWCLFGHIPPATTVYDLLNVVITEAPGSFTLSGDLCVSFEIANFLFGTAADTLKDVGDFAFTGFTLPQPIFRTLLEADGSLTVRGGNGIAGAGYTLLSSTNATAPLEMWSTNTTGLFAGDGTFSNAVPAAEAQRFFRVTRP